MFVPSLSWQMIAFYANRTDHTRPRSGHTGNKEDKGMDFGEYGELRLPCSTENSPSFQIELPILPAQAKDDRRTQTKC